MTKRQTPRKYKLIGDRQLIHSHSNQLAINCERNRKHKGLTQGQLALELRVSQTEVSYYESGWANPSLLTLIKLAKFFELTVVDLFLNSSPFVQIFDSADFNEQKMLPPGVSFETQTLETEQKWQKNVLEEKQLTVSIIEGNQTLRSLYLNEKIYATAGQTLTLPGGGDVELTNVEKSAAVFTAILAPRHEGRARSLMPPS